MSSVVAFVFIKYEDEFEVVDGRVKLGTSKKDCIEVLANNEDLFDEASKKVQEVMRIKREGGEIIDPHAEEIVDSEADDIFSV